MITNRNGLVAAALVVALGCASAIILLGTAAAQHNTRTPDTIGPAAQIVAPPQNYRYPNGQTYVYGVEWHLFNAGVTRVKMEAAGSQQKVTAIADSLGVVNLLYTIHDRFEADFDPRTFCSQSVMKHSEEGARKRDTQIQFDYTRHRSLLDEKNLKSGETKHAENDIPGCLTDVVTGFYYLASRPLQQGDTYTFPMNDGGKTNDVKATVEAREQVKVPAGAFRTVRVVAEPSAGALRGKGKIWVWFTDDPERTPVQMRAKLAWGTLVFRLQRLEKQ